MRDNSTKVTLFAANDNGAHPQQTLTLKLLPVVRLLARQAARECFDKPANDNTAPQGRERPSP